MPRGKPAWRQDGDGEFRALKERLERLEKRQNTRLARVRAAEVEIARLRRIASSWGLGVGTLEEAEEALGVELHEKPEQLATPDRGRVADLGEVVREVVIGEGERGIGGMDDAVAEEGW